MLKVVEIHQPALALCRRVKRVIRLCQFGQPVQRRGRHADIRRRFRHRQAESGLQFADGLFERVAPRLYAVGDILVKQIRLLFASQRRERHAMQRVVQSRIALCRSRR